LIKLQKAPQGQGHCGDPPPGGLLQGPGPAAVAPVR